jgi:hypothetical protein
LFSPAAGSGTTIEVTLLDSSGNPVSVGGSNPVIISVMSGSTLFPWFAPFAASQSHSNCSITAQIIVSGTGGASNTVSNLTIT